MLYKSNDYINGEYDPSITRLTSLDEITKDDKKRIKTVFDKCKIPYDKYFPVGFLDN